MRGVGEKTARALVETYESLDDLLADAAQAERAPGPAEGKPALKARILESADYIADMRRLVPVNAVAPLSVWSGPRDDEALMAFGGARPQGAGATAPGRARQRERCLIATPGP